jgi:hypothetical protein
MTLFALGSERKTADLSTALRFGRDDNFVARMLWYFYWKYGIRLENELSSRPERTRISWHAALDTTACAPFFKERRMIVCQRHQLPQEIRGSAVERSAVCTPQC